MFIGIVFPLLGARSGLNSQRCDSCINVFDALKQPLSTVICVRRYLYLLFTLSPSSLLVMTWFSFASGTKVEASNGTHHVNAQSTTVAVLETSKAAASSGQTPTLGDKTKATVSTTQQTVVTIAESQPGKSRRFSRQSFTFVRKQSIKNASPSTIEERDEQAPKTAQKQPQQKVSKSDKLAKQSALAMRSIVVGSASEAPKVSAAALKPELKKIKTQLLEPKTANKLITQLRQLPALDENHSAGPIHAVCLGHSDADENTLHFSKLVSDTPGSVSGDVSTFAFPDISDSIDKLAKLYQDMHVIDLIKVSDFGLGQPGDGEGLLAGALPTAQTVLEGVRQITPELMALGFATGKAITPDHTGMPNFNLTSTFVASSEYFQGIFPPTDRISVLTCE